MFKRVGDSRKKAVILKFKDCTSCGRKISTSVEEPFCQECFRAIIAKWKQEHPEK